jgi:hypothetical protein
VKLFRQGQGSKVLETPFSRWYWLGDRHKLVRVSRPGGAEFVYDIWNETDNSLLGAAKLAANKEYQGLLVQQKSEAA